MKKLISVLLLLCVCATLLVACQGPADKPEKPEIPNTPGNGGGEEEGGGEGDVLHGEPITAEIWETFTASGARPYENFTATMKATYSSGGIREGSVRRAGEEYTVTIKQGTEEITTGTFLIDGVLGHYSYDPDTDTWGKTTSNAMESQLNSPLASFPFDFEELSYHEETGSYSFAMYPGEDKQGEPVMRFEVCFKSGRLVYFKYEEPGSVSEWRGSDFGTTVVKRPAASEIK